MTDDEIRIAIATKCNEMHSNWWSISPDNGERIVHLPDYPNDLNAVREAEKTLIGNRESSYRIALEKIVMAQEFKPMTFDFAMINATARQRCEALLRVWGLWKE